MAGPLGGGRGTRIRTRWAAAGVHLALCIAIALATLGLMLGVWYPAPLFEAAGGSHLLVILVSVDVVVGPLITLIIFRRGKKGLAFDLTTIAVLQAAALIYGIHVVYLARPAFIVFVKDRFEVVSAVDLSDDALARARRPEFRHPPLTGPLLVAADYPTDPVEHNRLVELALAGIDLQSFPQYYAPYAERTASVLAASRTVDRLRASDAAASRIVDDWLARAHVAAQDVRYVPMRSRSAWLGVLIDAHDAHIVKMLIVEDLS